MEKINPENYVGAFKWEFEGYPFYTSVYNKAAEKEVKNKYYTSYADFMSKFEDGKTIAFNPSKPILDVGNMAIKESLEGNDGYLQEVEFIHEEINNAIKMCLQAEKENINSLLQWWPATQTALSHATFITSFDYTFDSFLKSLNEEDSVGYDVLQSYIKNDRLSFMDEAAAYLVELHKDFPGNNKQILDNFISHFGWFQNSYKGPFKIDEQWLDNFYKGIKDNSANSSHEDKNLKPLPDKYKGIVELVNEVIIFRDDKKKLLLLAIDLLDSWLKNICAENNWKYEVMRWLTVDEILEINQSKSASLDTVNKYYDDNLRLGLMQNTGYQDIDTGLWQEIMSLYENVDKTMEVKGVAASKGFYKGRVKIILDPKFETDKFKLGDVLVTSMTRPEFLPLMNKAGAFVTDEGGISCHAAIIAREMKKPCVIGTKNATRILKDGNMVEVDANKGIVKIIND